MHMHQKQCIHFEHFVMVFEICFISFALMLSKKNNQVTDEGSVLLQVDYLFYQSQLKTRLTIF